MAMSDRDYVLALEAVKAMPQGGEIALESRQGQGTRVRIRMPLEGPEEE